MGRAALLLVLAAISTGFEWPGRAQRLAYELDHADAPRRRELVRQLASYPAGAVEAALLAALEDEDPGVRQEAALAASRVKLAEATPILRDWLDDKDAATRATAARALAPFGDPTTRDALVRALGDTTAEVRRAAVPAVAALGNAEVVASLLGKLDDADVPVRVATAQALGRLADARAIVALGGRARDDAAEVRAAVMLALGQLGDPRSIAVMEQGLTDASEGVRIAAAAGLGRIGNAGAVRALGRQVRSPDARVARAVVTALAAIDDAQATLALLGALDEESLREPVIEALIEQARRAARTPGDNRVVGALVDALAKSRTPVATDRLAGILARVATVAPVRAATALLVDNAGSGSTSDAVITALGATDSAEAVVPLLERLGQSEGPRFDVVLGALEAHFQRNAPDGRAADPLLDALTNAAPEQQARLVALLGRVAAPRALPALRPFLASERADLRLVAIAAIARIGDAESLPAFLDLLRAADPDTRAAAADALRSTADVRCVGALLDRLEAGEASDRHAVLDALGGALARLDRVRALPATLRQRALRALAQALALANREASDRALDALVAWQPAEALSTIAARLREPSSRRRAHAALALGAFPGSEARSVLRYLLHRDTPTVVAAAAAALGEIGEQRDVAALVKLARRMHWPVPAAAAWAIARMAERGVLKEHTTHRILCELGRTREPYVRANAAAVMATWGAAACPEDGPNPLAWLARATSPVVRAAAARWAHAAAAAGRLDAAMVTTALDACAASDVDASVRLACAAGAAAPAEPARADAEIYAYATDGATPLRDALVALRLPNGSVFVGTTDANAHLRLLSTTAGSLVLEDPGLATPERE